MRYISPLLTALAAGASAGPIFFRNGVGSNTTILSQTVYGRLLDDYTKTPNTFFHSFDFWNKSSGKDPTGDGSSQYVGSEEAIFERLIAFDPPKKTDQTSESITEFTPNVPVLVGVESATKEPVGGRKSIRLTSKKSYNAGILLVASISHMPTGCSLWPALWMTSTASDITWPQNGEIDIIEGVNLQHGNSMALHTSPGCSMRNSSSSSTLTPQSSYLGSLQTSDCWVGNTSQPTNSGCSIATPLLAYTFGTAFNEWGGGTFAMAWEASGIAIWFFPATSVGAKQLANPLARPDTRAFGQPLARFVSDDCDMASHFKDLSIVLNTEICGSWAGSDSAWRSSGCAAATGATTCKQFAMQNPEAYRDAFWKIDSLKVYGH